jgi:hypothetical protein
MKTSPSGGGAFWRGRIHDGAIISGQTEAVFRASREAGGAMPVDIEPGARESIPCASGETRPKAARSEEALPRFSGMSRVPITLLSFADCL